MTSIEVLVAEFLKNKGYNKTLKTLENEAGFLYKNKSHESAAYETLEDIVIDRQKYLDYQESEKELSEHNNLIKSWEYCNIETSHLLNLWRPSLVLGMSATSSNRILISSTDKVVRAVNLQTKQVIESPVNKVILKSIVGIPGTDLICAGGMDGCVYLFQEAAQKLALLGSVKIHRRVISKICVFQQNDVFYVASIGLDAMLNVVELQNSTFGQVTGYKLISNATDLEVITEKSSSGKENAIIVVSRQESTALSIFALRGKELVELSRLSLNDAEFSSHTFSAMNMAVYQSKEYGMTLITVATSHVPYMRLITITLPRFEVFENIITVNSSEKAQRIAGETIRGLIVANVHTDSPQDKYSNPLIAWKSDGTGIWIAGDDGLIRGVNFKSNCYKVAKELRAFELGFRFKGIILTGDKLVTASTNKEILIWDGEEQKKSH